ncbi:energy transducer TonB [Marinoscillum sp.]|uniref:energy transducer TonB n=1 Tax=Marinoscillum sp. TaxID=2024838 RepID=UPI003BAC7A97
MILNEQVITKRKLEFVRRTTQEIDSLTDSYISANLEDSLNVQLNSLFLKIDSLDSMINDLSVSKINSSLETNVFVFARDSTKKKPSHSIHTGKVYTMVDKQPSPPKGWSQYYDWIKRNMVYSEAALKQNIEGRVFVQFVVEPDSTLTNIEVVRGLGFGCDEEAVRLIERSPHFIPGTLKGRPVRVRIVIPINF